MARTTGLNKKKTKRRTPEAIGIVSLSNGEMETLLGLARFYERSMGPMRHVVRLTASREVRAKYRFIAEESLWLERFAHSTLEEIRASAERNVDVELTSRALVAFWGRVLASLHSRRSRRRLKGSALAEREALEAKLRTAAQQLERTHPGILETDIRTRRPPEADLMRAALSELGK